MARADAAGMDERSIRAALGAHGFELETPPATRSQRWVARGCGLTLHGLYFNSQWVLVAIDTSGEAVKLQDNEQQNIPSECAFAFGSVGELDDILLELELAVAARGVRAAIPAMI